MRVLGLDFETTGLDTKNDRITEVGAVLWDTDTRAPLLTLSDFVYDVAMEEKFTPETTAMMARVSGITPEMLREFGRTPAHALEALDQLITHHQITHVVAHNGDGYDRPLLISELDRLGLSCPALRAIPWVDTKHDLPWETPPDSNRLKHLALDAGFINPFPHRAVFDVLTMLKVLGAFEFGAVLRFREVPWLVVRAVVSYDERQLAKDARYSWEQVGDLKFDKCWVKKIKANKLEEETKARTFQVVELKRL
jgi:DNA polymerase-3 subunit epsilon